MWSIIDGPACQSSACDDGGEDGKQSALRVDLGKHAALEDRGRCSHCNKIHGRG